MLVGLESG